MSVNKIVEVVNIEELNKKESVFDVKKLSEMNSKYSNEGALNSSFKVKNTINGLSRTNYVNIGEDGFKRKLEKDKFGIILGDTESGNYLLHFIDDTILELDKDVVEDNLDFLGLVPINWINNVIESYPKAGRKLSGKVE